MLYPKIQTISTKGQVVIPADYRELLGMFPRKKVILKLQLEKKRIVLQPLGDPIEELCGILTKKGETASKIKQGIRQEEKYYEKKKIK